MLIGFIGGRGSGKTLSLIKYVLARYRSGFDIYTNIAIRFPKEKGCGKVYSLNFNEFIKRFKCKNYQMKNCVIVLDELHVFIDSRRSNSPRNILFNKFVTQSRKRSVDVYYTTQDTNIQSFLLCGQVDLRTRKWTDEIIFSETVTKFSNGKMIKNCQDMIDPDKDKMYVVNKTYNKSGVCLNKQAYLGNQFFEYYDSDEIVDMFED